MLTHRVLWRTLTYCALVFLLLGLALPSAQDSLARTNPARRSASPTPATPRYPLTTRPNAATPRQPRLATTPRPVVPAADCWNVLPSPYPGISSNLASVAAISSSDVWAVGSDYERSSLVEHWDGSSWNIVPSPGSGTLASVSAISGDDVWAVGKDDGGLDHPLVEHYSAGVCNTPTPAPTTTTPLPTSTPTPTVTGTPPTATPTATPTPTIFTPVPCPYTYYPCLSLDGFTDHTVSLSWIFDPNIYPYSFEGYFFYRDTVYVAYLGRDATAVVDTGLSCSTPHIYDILASYSDELGTPYDFDSNPITVTTLPCLTPSVTPTYCANPFTDLGGNIFYSAIIQLYCHGVVSGTDSTHYSPAGTSTRGQFAKVVVLGFGTPFYTPSVRDFADVAYNYFAYLYIESGYHAGILSGFDQASCTAHGVGFPCYLPNIPITRGQLTKLVVNAAHYPLFTPTGGQSFTDVPPANVFYVSIETAHEKGIINGYPDQTFRPNNNIRRDEMAQIVYKGVTTP